MNVFLKKELYDNIAAYSYNSPFLHDDENITYSSYRLKINLLTYSIGSIYKNVNFIGIPLSVSEKGYCLKNEKGEDRLISAIKKNKGFTVVLNGDLDIKDFDLTCVNTLPTLIFRNIFKDFNDYLLSLRSPYRYRLNLAMKKFDGVSIKSNEFNNDLYKLYENVYEKSNFKLDKCSIDYFRGFGNVDSFYIKDEPLGFCQYIKENDTLYFLFCGLNYEKLKEYDTYYNILIYLIKRGIELGADYINFGQTTEEIKMKLGAELSLRYMYVYHSNKFVRLLIRLLKPYIGYKIPDFKFRVFKEGVYEAFTSKAKG